MIRQYIFSPLNSVNFTELNDITPSDTDYTHFGKDLFKNRIKYYSPKVEYVHDIKLDQIITIQLERSGGTTTDLQLKVYNRLGNAVAILFPQNVALAGNLDANGVQIYNFQWKFTANDLGIPSSEPDNQFDMAYELQLGQYFFVIESEIDGVISKFISEPINVTESIPHSLLFKYKNSKNDFDTIFKQFDTQHQFAIQGTLSKLIPEFNEDVFEDQDRELVNLRATPYRLYKLQIGVDKGVPDWAIDKLNYIIGCDNLKINGISFVVNDNNKWDVVETDNSLYAATITLREKDLSLPFKFSVNNTEIVDIDNPTKDLFVAKIALSDGVSEIEIINGYYIDEDSLPLLLTELNTTIVTTYNLSGEFAIHDDYYIVYNNSEDENYQVSIKDVTTHRMSFSAQMIASSPIELNIRGGWIGVVHNAYQGDAYYWSGLNPVLNESFYNVPPYSISTLDGFLVFFSEDVIRFGIINNNSTKIKNAIYEYTNTSSILIHTYIPSFITHFTLNNQDFSGSGVLDTRLFTYCANTIKYLEITYSGFKGFSGSAMSSFGTYDSLEYIDFSHNIATFSYLDAFSSDIIDNWNYVWIGYLEIANQTPPATGSYTSEATFLAAGWYFNHD